MPELSYSWSSLQVPGMEPRIGRGPRTIARESPPTASVEALPPPRPQSWGAMRRAAGWVRGLVGPSAPREPLLREFAARVAGWGSKDEIRRALTEAAGRLIGGGRASFDLDHADSLDLLRRQTSVLELIAAGTPLAEVLTCVAVAPSVPWARGTRGRWA